MSILLTLSKHGLSMVTSFCLGTCSFKMFHVVFSRCVVHPPSPRGPTPWQQHNGSPFSTLLTRHLIKWCETRGPAHLRIRVRFAGSVRMEWYVMRWVGFALGSLSANIECNFHVMPNCCALLFGLSRCCECCGCC